MTKRPSVFFVDTRLWHPAEGWRVFPRGETDPGSAWSEEEGGKPVAKGVNEGLLSDLAAAQTTIDELTRNLASRDHDLAVAVRDKEQAQADLAAQAQALADAQKAKEAAEAVASEVTGDRDRLAALVTQLQAKIAGTDSPEVNDKRTIETPAERAAVEVPADWETLPFFSKKALAAKLTDRPVATKAEVESVIREHLAQAEAA